MRRKPVLVPRESTKRLGMGKGTPSEVLWGGEWASPVATAMTI